MAFTITIDDDKLEQGLDDIAAQQALEPSRSALIRGMLRESVKACQQTGDPLAWIISREQQPES
jgi:predicted transcriptional regulator